MKSKKSYLILAAFIIVLVVGLSYCKTNVKKPVDWEVTYYNTHTKPFGTYISYELLKTIFPKGKIISTRRPIYNNLKDTLERYFEYNNYSNYDEEYSNEYDYETPEEYQNRNEEYSSEEADSEVDIVEAEEVSSSNEIERDDFEELYGDINIKTTTSYIFVNKEFTLDKLDLEYLLDFVGMGNNVFISSETFAASLLKKLEIKEEKKYTKGDSIFNLIDYPNHTYTYNHLYSQTFFNIEKSKYPVRVLGRDSKGNAVFLQVQFAKGNFYLHAVPIAFTNYYILDTEKYDYPFRCLSYLPKDSKVIWDEYQKQGMIGEHSSLREIFSSRELLTAFLIIIFGFLLFMIFRAKRTQRIIPIIKPPVNSSIEFLDTISNLYYQFHNYVTIINKRQTYLYDYIRKHYYLPTEHIDSDFVKMLSGKSGVSEETLNELFLTYKDLSSMYDISNEQFLKYNRLLEEFYRTVENRNKANK